MRSNNRFLTALLIALIALFTCGALFAQIKIMPLGDSITRGFDGSTDGAGYRNDLGTLLTTEGVNFQFVGSITGEPGGNHEGWDGQLSGFILSNINAFLIASNPDVVLLHIGTNDLPGSAIEDVRDNIAAIVDAIYAANPNKSIILSSLVPRADQYDSKNDDLNLLVLEVYMNKRAAGYKIFYAGNNEIFKSNLNWETAYMADEVHPNDTGYGKMAHAWFNLVMNAITNTDITITDNFQRTTLGELWGTDPEYSLSNGDLVLNSTIEQWQYLAVYRGLKNPTATSMKFGASASPDGVEFSALTLMLNSGEPNSASGYAVTFRRSANQIRLWEIQSGSLVSLLNSLDYFTDDPVAGDVMRVETFADGFGNHFRVYLNGELYGTLTDAQSKYGSASRLYSGIMLLGNYTNPIAEFAVEANIDLSKPATVALAVSDKGTTTITLQWIAPGDDGNSGTATSYDLRYSTGTINDANFDAATPAQSVPPPSQAGTLQTAVVSGLAPGTLYYFALKTRDDAGNLSEISNVVNETTEGGSTFVDNFNRASLGPDWSTDPLFAIETISGNGELANTSTDVNVFDLAVLISKKNALEVGFIWGSTADALGIGQGGLAVMLDQPSPNASGYFISRRIGLNQLRLWKIDNGVLNSAYIQAIAPNQPDPQAGQEFKVVLSSNDNGHFFDVYVNGQFDGRLQDPQKTYGNAADLYAGVMLVGGNNNNIDNFSVLQRVGSPSVLQIVAGDAQSDTVGQKLPIPLTVKLTDENGNPIKGMNVNYEVIAGGGSVDVPPPSEHIIMEAEIAAITPPMVIGDNTQASGGKFIHVPQGLGGANTGLAVYTFNVEETGNYVMWGRAIAPDAENDVFLITMDEGTEYQWDVFQRQPKTAWTWDLVSHRGTGTPNNPQLNPVTFNLSVGTHTLTVREGKDGTLLDQIIITNNMSYVPSGAVVPGGTFTDANGEAKANLTLGPNVGPLNNQVKASFSGISSVTFKASGEPGTVTTITKKSGDNQQGDKGLPLPLPLVVEVKDGFGNLATNAKVSFTIQQGNGTLSTTNPVTPNGQGLASTTLTLGATTGVIKVAVTALGFPGADIIFTASPIPGPPAKLTIVSGNNQEGTASKPLDNPFVVLVTDIDNIPVAERDVKFAVTGGGGNFAGPVETIKQTNGAGNASATLTLGPSPGSTNQAQVTVPGTSIPAVNFTATSANAQSLTAVSNLSLNGTASVPLPDSVKVRVKDTRGQNLANYPVKFEVTEGGGRANGSTGIVQVTTDANGIGKVEWRLGPQAGNNNNKLRASATVGSNNLTGSPIIFTASAVVGTADFLVKVDGDEQEDMVETILPDPFVVKVTDAAGNAVIGWPVTFTVKSGGGTINGKTSEMKSTDQNGLAQVFLKLGSQAGTPQNPFNNVVEASAENNGQPLNGSPVTFRAKAKSTGASILVNVQGNGQSGQAGLKLAQKIQVKVTDDNANPIADHSVIFTIKAGGGTINGTTKTTEQAFTNPDGIASVDWYLGGVLNQNNQRLEARSTDGINDLENSPMTFTATATAGPVSADSSLVFTDKSALIANGQEKATITVRLRDKFGNRIPGKFVLITATGTNNSIEQPTNSTTPQGEAAGTISSVTAENKKISAKVLGDNLELNTFVNVHFLSAPPERVNDNGGNNQATNVSTKVPLDISVMVTDRFNNPVPGVEVRFDVTGGSGFIAETSAPQQGNAASLEVNVTTTGEDGIASAVWVVGPNAGQNTATAKAFFGGAQLGATLTYTATGITATATKMQLYAGMNQDGFPAGNPLPQPLQVRILDSQDMPVANVRVIFNTQLGDGKANPLDPVSDYRGIAQAWFTLGPKVGTNVVDASNATLAGSPKTFAFTSVVGGPSIINRFSGNDETVLVNSTQNITVLVTDLYNNPVQNVHIHFDVIKGNPILQNPDGVTDVNGKASCTLTMPSLAGEVVVRATSSELLNHFTTFRLIGKAATAALFAIHDGNNQEGTISRPLVKPIAVKVTDAFGNPVSNYEVQWVRTLGGGTLAEQTNRTNDKGIAENIFTLGSAPGENRALAITANLSPLQQTFTANGVTNNFPEITPIEDKTVREGQLLQFNISAFDADSDPIAFSAENLPQGGSFNPTTATFSWTPGSQASVNSPYSVTFIAEDGRGGYDLEIVQITVTNSNNPPQITAYQPTNFEIVAVKGDRIDFSVTVTDADNDNLQYTWLIFKGTNPTGTLVSTSPGYGMDTENLEHATYVIQLTVTDGKDSEVLRWNIVDVVTSVELSSFTALFSGYDGVQINWETSRELNNTGFNVYRSRTEKGDYVKLNDKLIATSSKGKYSFADKDVKVGYRYYYKLEDVDLNGNKSENGPLSIFVAAPEQFELSQNYPNPFNPDTKIRYQMPTAGHVEIRIYDVLGREVRTLLNAEVEAGFHIVTWDSRNDAGLQVSSGVYYYRIFTGDGKYTMTKKMLLMK